MLPFEEGLPFEAALPFEEDEGAKQGPSLLDKAKGVGEAALSVASSIPAGVYGPMVGIAAQLRGEDGDKVAGESMQANTYEPRSELGKEYLEKTGEFINRYMLPLAPLTHLQAPHQAKTARAGMLNNIKGEIDSAYPVVDKTVPTSALEQINKLKAEEAAKKVIPEVPSQMELPFENTLQQGAEVQGAKVGQPDLFGPQNISRAEQGIPGDVPRQAAPPIETTSQHSLFDPSELTTPKNPTNATEGMWRTDENGIPIKADLTMEAQELGTPEQRALWGNELPAKSEQELANIDVGMQVPKGQRGGIDLSGISEGLRNMASATARAFGKEPKGIRPDTVKTPSSLNTLSQKADLSAKVGADAILKRVAPEYADVTTPEEAISRAANAKDINKNPARDLTISGINGQVMNARDNPVLNFTRSALQTARNTATAFSKEYITKDGTGVASVYRNLAKEDRKQALEILQEAARQRVELTQEAINKLELTPEQRNFIMSVRTAMDAMWEVGNDYTMSQRGTPLQKVPGYMPAIFNGTYKTLVGHMKEGRFVTEAVVQSDTKHGQRKAVDFYKKKNDPKFNHFVEQPRMGLGGQRFARSDLFNGFNDIINVLAKNDERFADIQALANQRVNDSNHKLMGFDVHELHKKGVQGALGDKPWLSQEKNAKEMGEAIINYLEQGSEYYSQQGALNDIGKVLNSPEISHMPNTKGVVQQHMKHITGQELNPIGSALNYTLDALPKALGVSYRIPLAAVRNMKNLMSLHLMGLWNPTFMALQWTQPLTGAVPEFLKVGKKLDISSTDLAHSAGTAPMFTYAMQYARRNGIDPPTHIPPHMVSAFDWAQKHGILDFSEMELAHNASRNQKLVKAENIAATPIRWGEKFSRPPVFMTFADLFHKFGLDDENSFRAAQHATNIAMGDYHPAERPKIYAQLGIVGEFAGALTTYKHNMLTQFWLRGKDAAVKDSNGKRAVAPAAGLLATASMLYGLTGMPGYDDADGLYQWITSEMGNRKSIRESALQDMPEWSKSGLLSSVTGLDFQTRTATSRLLPELKGASLSPQLAALFDMISKTQDFSKFGDEQSFLAMAKSLAPAGLKGAVEDTMLTNKEGYVENPAGEQLFEEPRTPAERTARRYLGLRPLRETLEQKDVFVDAQNVKEQEKRLDTLSLRFRQAWARGDQTGADTMLQKYYDLGGDPQAVLNSEAMQNQLTRSTQSQRDRLSGRLAASMKSLNRWREMHDD